MGGGGGKAQPRKLTAMRNSSLVNWSCSNVQLNGGGGLNICIYLQIK